jgi:hypothetical protein
MVSIPYKGIFFIVHAGWVTSKTDGQRHWISGGELVRLYGLRTGTYDVDRGTTIMGRGSQVVHLFPRYDGNYDLSFGRYRIKKVRNVAR